MWQDFFFALVLVNLNSIEGAASCGKILILLLWSLRKFESWFLNKETRKKQKAFKAKNELHTKNLWANFGRK
jgi:hypothetical protein